MIQKAADHINQKLREWNAKKTPILFLVSGGSALQILEKIDLEVLTLLGSDLTLGVLDERYSDDPQINNFCQFMQTTLFKQALNTGAVFIDTRVQEGELPEELAIRFETSLKSWRREHPHGRIIITQGMGSDGHTSGIMPYPENPEKFTMLFDNPEAWTVSYDAGNKNPLPLRITTTCTFLRKVDYALFYVMGEEKQAALARVCTEQGSLAETPARIVREMKEAELVSDISLHISYTKNS